MNEERLNQTLRRFLKTLGVGAQREIEAAVRAAAENGTLHGGPMKATAEIRIDDIAFRFQIDGTIEVS